MAALDEGVALPESDLRLLAAAHRRYHVLSAAAAAPSWAVLLYYLVQLGIATVWLVGPVVLVWLLTWPRLSVAGLVLATAVYLSAFGVVCIVHFSRLQLFRWRRQFTRLSILGTAASLTIAGALIAVTTSWTPLVLGLGAGVLVPVFRLVLRSFFYALALPVTAMVLRRCGMMPPAHLVAVMLSDLLRDLNKRGSWLRPAERRALLAEASWTIAMVGRFVPQVMWWAGIRGEVLAPTVRHCREAAMVLRQTQAQLVEVTTAEGFDRIHACVTAATVAVASGDWSLLTGAPVPGPASRLLALGRRLVTPAALVAAGLAVPALPGVTHSGSLTSIQIGLFTAALLSLTRMEEAAQTRILDAFRSERP